MSDRCERCGEVRNPDGQCACPKQQAQSELAAPAGSARAYADEQVEWLLGQIELIGKLKESDNRKLLWLGMNTKAWKALDVGGVEAEIFGEIENRLYPEYDGETVTFEEWGWRTPTGDIRYLPNVELCQPKTKPQPIEYHAAS